MIYLILVIILYIVINSYLRSRLNTGVEIYYGKAGTGKTSYASYLANLYMKKGYKVWSNVPIVGTYKLNTKEDLYHYNIENGLVIIDEGGLEHNNRRFKEMTMEIIKFYKLHRHYKLRVVVFSQATDVDITIERMAYVRYLLVPTLLKPFGIIKTKKIISSMGFNEEHTDLIEKLDFQPFWLFGTQYYPTKHIRHLFNSWEKDSLPEKEWEVWLMDNKVQYVKPSLKERFKIMFGKKLTSK